MKSFLAIVTFVLHRKKVKASPKGGQFQRQLRLYAINMTSQVTCFITLDNNAKNIFLMIIVRTEYYQEIVLHHILQTSPRYREEEPHNTNSHNPSEGQ